MVSYPGAIWVPTDKTDKVDLVAAEHMNRVQDEAAVIQAELGANVAGSQTDLVTRLARMMSANGSLAQGTSFPGSPNEGDIFYRTDEDVVYVYDGSSWDAQGVSLSNVIHTFRGEDRLTGSAGPGLVSVNTQVGLEADAHNLYYVSNTNNNTNYVTIIDNIKFHKLAGINTLTVYARSWGQFATATSYKLNCDVGGAAAVGESGAITATSPAWVTPFTVDVSGLSDGTVYDLIIRRANLQASGNITVKISSLFIFAS